MLAVRRLTETISRRDLFAQAANVPSSRGEARVRRSSAYSRQAMCEAAAARDQPLRPPSNGPERLPQWAQAATSVLAVRHETRHVRLNCVPFHFRRRFPAPVVFAWCSNDPFSNNRSPNVRFPNGRFSNDRFSNDCCSYDRCSNDGSSDGRYSDDPRSNGVGWNAADKGSRRSVRSKRGRDARYCKKFTWFGRQAPAPMSCRLLAGVEAELPSPAEGLLSMRNGFLDDGSNAGFVTFRRKFLRRMRRKRRRAEVE